MEPTHQTKTHLPVVVVVSPDLELVSAVAEIPQQHLSFKTAHELEQVIPLFEEMKIDLIVADLRSVRDGGHGADRLIEHIHVDHPECNLAILTNDEAPELLERRAACSDLSLYRGQITPDRVHEIILDVLPIQSAFDQTVIRKVKHDSGGETFGEVVFEGLTRKFETRSPELKQMLEDLMIAAGHDVTILLIGETGSGKTYLSSLIHESSPRVKEPFLHVACGALPRELIESELFGHNKGSFTSAHMDKEGKFIAAKKGTILLDEIDVLGPEQQVKLLKVIETGEFEPVGSNVTLKSQARLVVASNLDLQPLVEKGLFRPDLYYRLSMLKFEIPPLRRRKMDIIPMAKRFIAQFQQKHGIQVHRIEDAVLDALLSYPWPGNVRELEHVIQRAVIYCRDGVLTPAQLPPHILAGNAGPTNDPTVKLGNTPATDDQTLEQQVALNEREIIEQALFKNNFSRTKTAKELGISRVTLYNKMKKYEMLK